MTFFKIWFENNNFYKWHSFYIELMFESYLFRCADKIGLQSHNTSMRMSCYKWLFLKSHMHRDVFVDSNFMSRVLCEICIYQKKEGPFGKLPTVQNLLKLAKYNFLYWKRHKRRIGWSFIYRYVFKNHFENPLKLLMLWWEKIINDDYEV